MLDAEVGRGEHLDDVAPGLLALRLKTFGYATIGSFRHLAADEQQPAVLAEFQPHAVAARRSVNRYRIMTGGLSHIGFSPVLRIARRSYPVTSPRDKALLLRFSTRKSIARPRPISVKLRAAMTYTLPPLNALRAFEAAARHLSFKLAAHELHVTPAAVGQQVKALEARLGVRLFERLHKQLILTAAGQAYLPGISDGFRRIADATSQLKPAGAVLLQLGLHGSFDLRRLELAEFRNAHAEIGLRVLQPAGLHELVEGKVDLLIARGLGHHPGYRCDRVNEGSGLGDWLIAPEGTADCPEVVSFREWLRALPAENPLANHRRPRLVGIIGS
jgi:LysR family transcriptional regulator, glycine cleavage system transcriptional activator